MRFIIESVSERTGYSNIFSNFNKYLAAKSIKLCTRSGKMLNTVCCSDQYWDRCYFFIYVNDFLTSSNRIILLVNNFSVVIKTREVIDKLIDITLSPDP